jgi:hypothetical protein
MVVREWRSLGFTKASAAVKKFYQVLVCRHQLEVSRSLKNKPSLSSRDCGLPQSSIPPENSALAGSPDLDVVHIKSSLGEVVKMLANH